ncbi:hypothetical protein [Yersinia enterocolitica]|uniref:Glycosyltransferase n=1 Tax=Yersinia enterocolitica serotype O:8 / biotype 1B (strain NCTC 13174 / 8081) TaxID=393305 RepID=A1JN71_YERE8|nr:hypothetical protein [Yersinia enterocolitica]AJJ22893.1 putative glycosyltransferase [Yersinia enterocolitica]CAL13114.1 hypothetical protein YE3079 [Yersinia enterocolitica subsp. enterocolitica 8081]CNF86912.1 Uncharacterised protein [Yersinia enterocolitica]CRY23076.1 Uncharacterised protein [Yersinia enterocolitica]HDL8280944.1 hypothetical protein [Yersinia enterocolitica]
MIPSFSDPLNTFSTGVTFLKSILFKESVVSKNICSKLYLFTRFFSKNKCEKVVFIPIEYKCLLAYKDDIIILPDDSLRSIQSIAKVRFANRSYLKFTYQVYRYIITYILISSLRRCVLYTVSKDDETSLKRKFPKNNIKYLPHPIQARYNLGRISDFTLNVKTIGFINLQNHYSVDATNFLSYSDLTELKNKTIIFHGSASKNWFQKAKELYVGVDFIEKRYIEDFDTFFDSLDLVIMPLDAGAGVKNILLNSVYKNKLVFGTKEAFSGIPEHLAKPFIINSIGDINEKLKKMLSLEKDFFRLREYILEHHTIENFKSALCE